MFTWTAGPSLTATWLDVGTTLGGAEIYAAGHDTARTSRTVSGLPANGQLIYVRFWSLSAGKWSYIESTFTSAAPVPAGLLTPTRARF